MSGSRKDRGSSSVREPRVYVDQVLDPHAELSLDRERSHHLLDVLRLGVGSRVVLFDDSGQDWPARITDVGKRVQLRVDAARANHAESPLHVTLWQGVSQAARMDACLRQSVELGVHEFRPLSTTRSQVRLDARRAAKKHEHWQAIAISAAEQCGRARLPTVHPLASVEQALASQPSPNDRLSLVLVPDADAALGNVLPEQHVTRVELLIGPESGLAEREIEQARAAGFTPVRAGPRTLRTETAGPAAIAILQARFGDMLNR